MNRKSNFKRIRQVLRKNSNDELDHDFTEDVESNSDTNYSPSETEFADTSTDVCIPRDNHHSVLTSYVLFIL
jgi:hypothetical protein